MRDLLAEGFADIEFEDAWFPMVAGSAEEARNRWLSGFGPMRQTYADLTDQDREALRADLVVAKAGRSSIAAANSSSVAARAASAGGTGCRS